MLRSPCDPVIRPRPVAEEKSAKTVGTFRILVLVRLRNSDRNSSFLLSPRENSFLRPISKFLRPGPRTLPLLQFPNLPAATGVKLLESNHWMPPPCEDGTTVFG